MVLTGLHTTSIGESGSSVVFLHGLFGQGKNWTQIGKALAGDHRIVLVDLPHHGRSAWSDSFDFVAIADQVAEALSADDPVALVGHSMGGKVAMVLALRHPELVERLCVVDVAPVAYDHTEEFAGYIEAMRAHGPRLARSSAATPTRRSRRRSRTRACARSCSRTCAARTTAGAGSSTSTCSARTWTA